jgi:hypothetical protein
LHARGWSIQDWNKSYQVGSYTNPHWLSHFLIIEGQNPKHWFPQLK